jgi:hypothetical protein
MTFEETYPRYAFSELVRLALIAARFSVRVRKWRQAAVERHHTASLGSAKPVG